MKRVCAWCGKDMGEKEPLADTGVTHGICEACAKKEFGGMYEESGSCNLNKAACNASEEELKAFFKKVTGKEPEPERIQAMRSHCDIRDLPGVSFEKNEKSLISECGSQVSPIGTPDAELDKSQSEEAGAQHVYWRRAKAAADAGLTGKPFPLAELYGAVAKDEEHHEDLFLRADQAIKGHGEFPDLNEPI